MLDGEKFNTYSHMAGAALALTGLVFLVIHASLTGDPWKIVSTSLYGATLVLLYFFSTLYHGMRGRAKQVLQKIDHSAIYLLIAGTYTPYTLVTLRGALGWSVFSVIWGLAVLGIIQDTAFRVKRRALSVVLYVVMGWLSLILIGPLARSLPAAAVALLAVGGLSYTIGIIFYAFDDRVLPHSHGIFHLFVLTGSVCHYLSIVLYVV